MCSATANLLLMILFSFRRSWNFFDKSPSLSFIVLFCCSSSVWFPNISSCSSKELCTSCSLSIFANWLLVTIWRLAAMIWLINCFRTYVRLAPRSWRGWGNKQWEKLVIILQNTKKISKRKTASKNITSPHKLSLDISQKFLILADPLCPHNTLYKLKTKNFWTNLIPIKIHCYFFKVYKVTVTKLLKFLYLITIDEKYCNSKKVLCNDLKNLLSSVRSYVFSSCLLHEKERASYLSYEN